MRRDGYLFTLLIYTEEEKQKRRFERLLSPLIGRFPCRILSVDASAHLFNCEKSEDRIAIDCPKEELARIPSLILPYVVPDLPIYLIWGCDPTMDQTLLPRFETVADRLIFDADCVDNLEALSCRLLKEEPCRQLPFIDFDWASMGCWRRTLAQIFYTEERVKELRKMETIAIRYATSSRRPHPERRALYLQAWLAAQMNWSKKAKEGASYRYLPGCLVTLEADTSSPLPPGSLLEISMKGQNHSSCLIQREEKTVTVRLCLPHQCELPFSLPLRESDLSLAFIKDLFYHPVSPHYKKMLEMIAS